MLSWFCSGRSNTIGQDKAHSFFNVFFVENGLQFYTKEDKIDGHGGICHYNMATFT